MTPEFSLSLGMQQRLEMVMTPQMIQSMEMLQLPLLALEQRIQQELLENPALELAEMREEPAPAAAADESEPDTSGEMAAVEASEDLRKVDEIDYDWDDFYESSSPRRHSGNNDERFDLVENTPSRQMSFADYLESQLSYVGLDDRAKRLCGRVIYNLDPAGYLQIPLSETTDPEEEPPPTAGELEAALGIVQTLDPPGVGARDVKECLLLQVDALGGNHQFERDLVECHLENIAANRLPQIAKAMGCTIADIKGGAAFIRTLNPHPGLDYGPGALSHVYPDVLTEVDENGEWEVRLVNGSQPEISDMFLALFDSTRRGRQLREELLQDPERASQFKQMQKLLKNGSQGKIFREKYQSARWLVTAVAQRERTLLRVTNEIVKAQRDYLSGQADAPGPLMMQEVADLVGIDISTVSRAVRDKYMDTPLGLKPLRMFFTRDVGGRGGRKGNSNVHIMNRIRSIIQSEDKLKPFKDDQILAVLAREGIEIKRRTVAKYRANLDFPNHSQRREF